MRVYVAASLANAPAARALMDRFRSAGSEITLDWTDPRLLKLPPEEIAALEIDAVRCADLLVLLCPGGRGAHVEMGIAIGTGNKVIVVGATAPIAFYSHRNVMQVASVDELFQVS